WTVEGDTLVGLAGRCLDVTEGSTEDGTQVQLWDCNGEPWQKWTSVAWAGETVGSASDTPAASSDATPPTTTEGQPAQPPSGSEMPANGGEVWHESFDNGR